MKSVEINLHYLIILIKYSVDCSWVVNFFKIMIFELLNLSIIVLKFHAY
jgi:hypothetical protein